MTGTFATAMNRAARLMRPRKLTRSTRSMQKAMTGFMIASTFAPMSALRQAGTAQSPATWKTDSPVGRLSAKRSA